MKNTGKAYLGNMFKSILILAAAAVCSIVISHLGIGKESVIMVYLLGVLFTTVLTGSITWGIIVSVLSLVIFNYVFTEPRFNLAIYSTGDIALLIFFLVTAVVSGFVTSRLQQQMELAAENERTANILYSISSGFLSISGSHSIVLQGISYIKDYTGFECEVFLDEEDQNFTSLQCDDTSCCTYPILCASGKIGCLKIQCGGDGINLKNEMIIKAVASQMGIALYREQLYKKQEQIRRAMEKEKLRTTLLRSVAHDLRSPLTGLSGACSLLSDNYERLSDEERRKLAGDMGEEVTWLINLVENILNMTRIDESQMVIHKEYEVVDDVVSEAVRQVDRLIKEHNLHVSLPEDVVAVPMDGRLIVQVLINLLENAVRHTPPKSEIWLSVDVADNQLKVSVADNGNGIEPGIKDKLFNRFTTSESCVTDGKRGIGLGLAICKAVIDAHGGIIKAEDNLPKGARFTFTLPMED